MASVRPGGGIPAVRLNVEAGEPLAVNVWLYATPRATGEGGGELVM